MIRAGFLVALVPLDVRSGLQFDSATGTCTYVWKTSKSWAGTCQQFDLQLNDGTDHIANFQFK